MKIPCVCPVGSHSFTANEMVDIIGAFQRGELSKVRGIAENKSIIPLCLATADFDIAGNGKFSNGPCDVELENGTRCKHPRGHRDGRHGQKVRGNRMPKPTQEAA